MQSLTRSPFRVADEINEGIDPRNERLDVGQALAVRRR